MEIDEFKLKALPLKNKLFRIAKRLLNDFEDTQDAIQEVYMKLWEKRYEMDKYSNIEAFAVTVTKNHCIDKLRKKRYEFAEINEDILDTGIASPEAKYLQKEIFERISKVIETLPETQKIVLQLRDIEGFAIEEIAEIMQSNVGNIRVLLSRARSRVKEILIKKHELRIA